MPSDRAALGPFRDGCCADWPKPCGYHEGWDDAVSRLERAYFGAQGEPAEHLYRLIEGAATAPSQTDVAHAPDQPDDSPIAPDTATQMTGETPPA